MLQFRLRYPRVVNGSLILSLLTCCVALMRREIVSLLPRSDSNHWVGNETFMFWFLFCASDSATTRDHFSPKTCTKQILSQAPAGELTPSVGMAIQKLKTFFAVYSHQNTTLQCTLNLQLSVLFNFHYAFQIALFVLRMQIQAGKGVHSSKLR